MSAEPKPAVVASARLGAQLLLVTGHLGRARGTMNARVTAGATGTPATAWILPAAEDGALGLAVVRSAAPVGEPSAVRFGRGPKLLLGTPGDLAGVLRASLSAAAAPMRARALGFLVAELSADADPAVADALATARTILRDRLREIVVDANRRVGAQVELVAVADDRSVYVRGWAACLPDAPASLRLVTPAGETAELPPTTFRYARPDVATFFGLPLAGEATTFGFAALCTFEHRVPMTSTGWLLELTTTSGEPFETACPPALVEPRDARDHLVGELAIEHPPSQALRVHHLLPAVGRLQERLNARVRIARNEQFGRPLPVDPDVSVIVPLYRRIDFVTHQLAQFVLDPAMAAVELIYVLDSPEQAAALLDESERLARLYRVPFRVLVLSENGGFSVANNLGVSVARGRLVLLMNSDVLPDRPGWLGDLVAFHDGLDDPGAVGPKLVYEDESLQHAGMWFDRPPGTRAWNNEHYFKGLHRSFPDAARSRPVPAVTAACLLVRAALYREAGGLRGMYVQGDFEDSDLCLRLAEAGHPSWYAAHVELYHLEGQSYPSAQRRANGEFNRWLHTHLWDSRIAALMAAHDAGVGADA